MWHYIHRYRALAELGRVKHLTCPDCGTVYTPTLNPEDDSDEPWLYCAGCNSMVRPGLDLFNQIKAVVHEWSL